MITIKFNDISIQSASENSGVFLGRNHMPFWTNLSKSNTVVSGNSTNSTNILSDNDGFDYTIEQEFNDGNTKTTRKTVRKNNTMNMMESNKTTNTNDNAITKKTKGSNLNKIHLPRGDVKIQVPDRNAKVLKSSDGTLITIKNPLRRKNKDELSKYNYYIEEL